MDEKAIIDQLTDVAALAGTMYAEAAGDSKEGGSSVEERIAVGCVIRTRVEKFRQYSAHEQTVKGICLAHNDKGTYQFDCWRPGSGANHDRLIAQMGLLVEGRPLTDLVLKETLYLAEGVLSSILLDRTKGANMYYAPVSMVPPGSVPSWAKGKTPVAAIGSQLFYKF